MQKIDFLSKYTQQNITQHIIIIMISTGGYHNFILTNNNELYACGNNEWGQLGLGDNMSQNTYTQIGNYLGKITNISCGENSTFILNDKNELYVCGFNELGLLGLGNYDNANIFTKINHNFGKIKNIFGDNYHYIILTMDNQIFVCGLNVYGQLGLGNNENNINFIKLEHNFGIIKNIATSSACSYMIYTFNPKYFLIKDLRFNT
jgi:hypothetical protein